MRNRRRIIHIVLGTLALASVASAKETRLRYATHTAGGAGGQPKVVSSSWYRPDGTQVQEVVTYGMTTKRFKGAQTSTNINTGRESIKTETEGLNLATRTLAVLKGAGKGTFAERRWRTGRYEVETTTDTRPGFAPLVVIVHDVVWSKSVILKDVGEPEPEVTDDTEDPRMLAIARKEYEKITRAR